MEIFQELALSSVSFTRHLWGIIVRPYKTYRSILEYGRWVELVYVALLCSIFFAVSSLVKIPAFHPLLLTQQFIILVLGSSIGFFLSLFAIALVGKLLKKPVILTQLGIAWGYTLIPTVLWFLMTSLLYILLPPPRTESVLGILFSIVYLTSSTVLFFWKAELYYLTLRFGLQLDLKQIILATVFMIPVFFFYSYGMYQWGIFRVPFL